MGKKSQKKKKDFQKTKLKVGRQLPKGGNVTDTSFKTKQIITPDQTFVALADRPLPALLNYLNTKNVVQKLDTLKKIQTYIQEHKESLAMYFPDILSKLGNVALESDPALPALAVTVISTCLKLLTDVQYQTFSNAMVLHLNCMMSHGALTVKQSSLQVLKSLLETHPKIVTQQPKLLHNLLNMISSLKGRGQQVRRLDDLVNSAMASYSWHQEVLEVICHFMRVMLEPKEDVKKKDSSEDDGGDIKYPREVYWDGKTDLYLPLYAAKGPVKVDMSWYASAPKREDEEFKKFVFELLDLLSDVLKGELPCIARGQQDVILSQTDVKYLNLIVQLLCHAGEFARENLQLEGYEFQKMSKPINAMISLHLLNGFPFAQHGNVIAARNRTGPKEDHCIQLNLGICYLSAMFLLESDDVQLYAERAAVIGFLQHLFLANTDLNDRSLSIYLKASRILLKSKYLNLNFKNAGILAIYDVLEVSKLSQQSQMLCSFFMDLSLDDNYRDIFSSEGIKNWFKVIGYELAFMAQTHTMDMKMLHYIKQICCRKYPVFMEYLNTFDLKELIKAIQYDHEDFQITIIHMILALDVIPASLLNDLSNVICQNNAITLKMSVRLIYHLHARYSRPRVSEKEQLLFVKFLLNTACDTRALRQDVDDFEPRELLNFLFTILGKTNILIYPTKKWKTHQKIFEVCLELLVPYCDSNSVTMGTSLLVFARSLFNTDSETIPVHTVLAFLLVREKIGYRFEDDNVLRLSYVLMFSSFLYLSIMASKARDLAKLYCVPELQKCLLDILGQQEVTHLIQLNESVFSKLPIEEFVYALKVIMFLNTRGKINLEDEYIHGFFRQIRQAASQSPILVPIWHKICNT